ncbi:WLM domain-containing protein [Trichoderma velutinum]
MIDVATPPNNHPTLDHDNDNNNNNGAASQQQEQMPSSTNSHIDNNEAIGAEATSDMQVDAAPSAPSASAPEMDQEHHDEIDSEGESENAADRETVSITVSHRGHKFPFEIEADLTVTDLFHEIENVLEIPFENIKVMVPKGPFLKAPLKDPEYQVKNFAGKTVTVMGSTSADVQAVQAMCQKLSKMKAAREAQRSKAKSKGPARRRGLQSAEDSKYTFLQVRPLSGLPHPERSLKLLNRLKEDPGIKTAMRKHKFTVALLTEMEPLAHTETTHEGTSRILGLNRNQGEVIELRLRTDAHDGYRDYKTIRKTLCHELTHNVHGPHDRQFWDLCHQIEREVDAADWKSNGRTIGESSRYHISGQDQDDEDVHEDDGGWTGGEFVLGGNKASSAGLSRREILAQAALDRQRKEEVEECNAEKGWRPCQRPQPNNDRNL